MRKGSVASISLLKKQKPVAFGYYQKTNETRNGKSVYRKPHYEFVDRIAEISWDIPENFTSSEEEVEFAAWKLQVRHVWNETKSVVLAFTTGENLWDDENMWFILDYGNDNFTLASEEGVSVTQVSCEIF